MNDDEFSAIFIRERLKAGDRLSEVMQITHGERIRYGKALYRKQRRLAVDARTGPKRICFITPQFVYGGVERWFMWLAQSLDPTRYVCTDMVVRSQDAFSLELASNLPRRVQVHQGDVTIAGVTEQCDVALSWGAPDMHMLASAIVCPHVSVIHGANGSWWQRSLVESAIQADAHLVGVSGACQINLPDECPVPFTVLANGIDPGHVCPSVDRGEARKRLGIDAGARVALMHSRLVKDKRPGLLCEAVAELPDDWVALVAGMPDRETPDLARQWRKMLGDRLILREQSYRVGDLLVAADVSVCCSLHESFCYQVVESWMAGVPSVTTRTLAYEWFAEQHGELSTAVQMDATPKEVADAIASAYGSQVLAAQHVAYSHYTAARMADRWMTYLDAILRPASAIQAT